MGSTKTLIIGGLGFIGSHVAEECLNKGHRVTIMSRSMTKIDNVKPFADQVELIIKDLADIGNEVAGFDLIFDLSGSVATNSKSLIESDPTIDIKMNCINSIHLLEAVKKYNPKCRLIFASTFFVNGQPESLPVDINSPCKPLELYGATKLAAEHFYRIYNNVFSINNSVVRFTNVFGVNERSVGSQKAGFNFMIQQACLGRPLKLYDNGDFYRDYIYVSDAAKACLTVAEKGNNNRIYYIGRGEFVKFKELVDLVVKHTGVKVNPIDPPDFHKRVGIKDFVCDNSPLKELGWQPEISLDEGVKRTIDYYKSIEGNSLG